MSLLSSSRSLSGVRSASRAFACVLGILAALMLGTGLSQAASGGVVDNGAFFSEQAKSDAAKVIGEMERTLRKGVLVETFKEIPVDMKAGVKFQDKAALDRFYDEWAVKQARQHAVNGVYILIVKNPSHLQTVVGTDTLREAFTQADRAALVKLMLFKLGANQYDEALRDGVNFVANTMKSHAGNRPRNGVAPVPAASRPAESSGGGMGWLVPAIVTGLVVWVVIGLFRALSGRMGGAPAMGQQGGGGGFFSSLIGGMFGAAAGMWMYDQFFSNHGNSAYGADHHEPNSGDSGFTGQDSDYSGSGGDFGSGSDNGSSGGDFGGGGDSGGGGDF